MPVLSFHDVAGRGQVGEALVAHLLRLERGAVRLRVRGHSTQGGHGECRRGGKRERSREGKGERDGLENVGKGLEGVDDGAVEGHMGILSQFYLQTLYRIGAIRHRTFRPAPHVVALLLCLEQGA